MHFYCWDMLSWHGACTPSWKVAVCNLSLLWVTWTSTTCNVQFAGRHVKTADSSYNASTQIYQCESTKVTSPSEKTFYCDFRSKQFGFQFLHCWNMLELNGTDFSGKFMQFLISFQATCSGKTSASGFCDGSWYVAEGVPDMFWLCNRSEGKTHTHIPPISLHMPWFVGLTVRNAFEAEYLTLWNVSHKQCRKDLVVVLCHSLFGGFQVPNLSGSWQANTNTHNPSHYTVHSIGCVYISYECTSCMYVFHICTVIIYDMHILNVFSINHI